MVLAQVTLGTVRWRWTPGSRGASQTRQSPSAVPECPCIISDAVERPAQADGDKVWFDEVEIGDQLQPPFNGQPFAVLLLVNRPGVPTVYREDLSGDLVRAGCGYAVCAGLDQEAWHASIDVAGIRQNRGQNDEVVMTTSHPN